VDVRSLLDGLPTAVGVYEVGNDAVVEIIEAAAKVPHARGRAAWPASQVLEEDFRSGPIFAYRLKNGIANVHTGAVYDATGALIRESFGTQAVMGRYMPLAALPGEDAIVEAPAPFLPLATTRIGNYCRWWLDSMAKVHIVRRSTFAGLNPLPTIFGARRGYQQQAMLLLDDVRVLSHNGPRFFRGDIINSPGVTYNGGQRIGQMVGDVGRDFAAREGAEAVTPKHNRKLFISRRSARIRRIVNEADLRAQLGAKGFETAELEHLSLAEQMALIASARIIVAPHGAGLTNLLWAQPGTTLVEIFPEGGVHGSAFMRIATQMGLGYFAIVGAAGENRDRKNNPNNADIELNVPEVVQFITDKVLATAA
jgi:hypothetical protein